MQAEQVQSEGGQASQSGPFVVKVKLLSNEVFEFEVASEILIADFKKLIQEKTNVPAERQRLVYSGKQLVDTNTLKEYVKQSGMTVHLIAKMQSPEPAQTNQNVNNVPPAANNANSQGNVPNAGQSLPRNQMPIPIPNIFGMVNSLQDPANLQNTMNNMMNSFGIRIVQGGPNPLQVPQQPQPQQQQQPPQPQQQPQHQPQPSPPNSESQPRPTLNINPINQLQHNISRLNMPPEVPPTGIANGRELTAQYLRKLQNEMLRFIPQLNRGIQLLQEGRVGHLADFLPIFQALNGSNAVAMEAIQRLLRESTPQEQQAHSHNHHHHHNHNHNQNHNHNNQHSQPPPPPQPQPNSIPTINATIIIGDQPAQSEQNNSNQPPNVMNMLNGFLQQGSGFNFANLFAPPQPPQPPQPAQQSQQPQQQQQPQPQQQQQQQQQPQPQQQQAVQQTNPQQQPNPQANQPNAANPFAALGGINVMDMFNNLQQTGGMGQVLGLSLGDMLQDEGAPPTVYSAILKPISGGEVMACFTQKDFSFFNQKKPEFKQAVERAITIAGSRQNLIAKYSQDMQKLLIPTQNLNNQEECKRKIDKILTTGLSRIVTLFEEAREEVDLSEAVLKEMKTLYCKSLEEIGRNSNSMEFVFQNMKINTVRELDRVVPGLSGLFYSIIERDLFRIFREYYEQEQRRRQQSEEEAQNEEELLKKIEEEAERDEDYLSAFEHSKYYSPKQ